VARDKASLDIFWLRDESLEDTESPPPAEVIAAVACLAKQLGGIRRGSGHIRSPLAADQRDRNVAVLRDPEDASPGSSTVSLAPWVAVFGDFDDLELLYASSVLEPRRPKSCIRRCLSSDWKRRAWPVMPKGP
jgi:hypothetical protein